ncbi:MAG TPA: hypothetical protein VIM84_00545 [Gemmatimonadales bacterium]
MTTTFSTYWNRLRCQLGFHRWIHTGRALYPGAHYERCRDCALESRVTGRHREEFSQVRVRA